MKSFLNDDDIDFNLKVSPNDASAFINSRKDKASGYVNRVVFLKVNFTLTRVHSTISFNSVQYTLVGYIHSIEVWSDPKFQGKKLGELIPRVKYDNPVQGIKKLNAIDTVYWDNKWRFVANKANASFYSVVKYEEGRIPDAIRSYYMSGVRQSEGRYISFYPKPNIPNGLFTWFYDKTGDLQAQVTYENGLYNGRFTSWYISGKPQEIVMYVNGNKDGCDKQYDEDGNCRNGSWSGPGYFDLYENGKNAVGKQVRPCDK